MNSLGDVTAMVDRNCSDLNLFFLGRPTPSVSDAAAPDPMGVREIPRLQELVRTRILNSNLDVSRLPLDFNRQLLENVRNLTDWLRARNLCSDEAVLQNSTQLASLIKQGPITDTTKSDRIILKHVFNQIFSTTTAEEEMFDLMDWKRTCRPLIKESPNRLSELAGIVVYYTSGVIASPYFQYVGGLALSLASTYVIWVVAGKVTGAASAFVFPLATKYLPSSLINTARFIDDNLAKIWFGFLAVGATAKLISPRYAGRVFNPLFTVIHYTIFYPFATIAVISSRIGLFFMAKSEVLSAEIDRLNDDWQEQCVEKEVYEAREEWIRQVLLERKIARTQVEADYATQNLRIHSNNEPL